MFNLNAVFCICRSMSACHLLLELTRRKADLLWINEGARPLLQSFVLALQTIRTIIVTGYPVVKR